MDTIGDESIRSDITLTKALRKSQDKCQMLLLEREDLQKRLNKVEGDTFHLSSSTNKAETQNLQYAEEKQRLLDEVVHQRREIKSAQDKLGMYRQESLDAKKNASLSRDQFQSIINQQRAQIEKLQEYADAASNEAEKAAQSMKTLKQATNLFITERCNLMHMLIDTLHTMQTLFYDPSPFLKASYAKQSAHVIPSKIPASQKSSIVVAGTDQYKREIADLREIASQLEKEIAESSATYKQLMQRLSGEADRAQRMVAQTTKDPGSTIAVCNELIENASPDTWDKDREVFHQAIKHMEYKFNQLMKIRSVVSSRDEQFKKTMKPIWQNR
jgi:predicted nuclease with TOPRIM domain